MRRYITAFVIFTMLFFSTISTVKAENCIEIPGDVVETRINYQFKNNPPKLHDRAPAETPVGKGYAEVVGFQADGRPIVKTVFNLTDKNIDTSTMQADMDAVMDKRNSETHNHDTVDYPNMDPDSYAKNSKIDGTTVKAEGVVTGTESEAAIMYKNAAEYMIACEEQGKTPSPEEVARHSTTLKPGTKAYDDFTKNI
ncbi:hypothetical protein [Fenollaria timonensis]|uniref:hypothetical protein n=1 Tax=Fenollaria timonensis TaxID=1723384 RepID=UPI00071DA912|nr:hypothetical protein [Fenollaria timonensis]